MNPGSNTESYPAFTHIGLRKNPGNNLNQLRNLSTPTKRYFENDERVSKRMTVTRRDSKDKYNEHSERERQLVLFISSDNAGEMSPGSSTERYPEFAHIGLRENPGKNLNQVILRRFTNILGYLASERDESDNAGEMSPRTNTEIFPAFSHIRLRETPEKPQPGYLAAECDEGDNAGEMSPGSNTENYPAFAHIGLRENPGKNINQQTLLAMSVSYDYIEKANEKRNEKIEKERNAEII
ncbi:hypothetical protein ANN_09621 [Periplaneta americana]|uniref:Uncharacterized protein n=1 Tax=Periplaneta americana TaxID=6978 RepID=A0ABQ8TM54_PERAM|nr:hypothetical protein ANN_09621 [Periplaneta americana]